MRWNNGRLSLACGLVLAALFVLIDGAASASTTPPTPATALLTATPTPEDAGIRGTVIDGGDGRPAADVQVCASTFAESRCATTGPDGTYRIANLNLGNYVVTFESSGRFLEQCWEATSCDTPTLVFVRSSEDIVGIDALMYLDPLVSPTPTPSPSPTATPPVTPTPSPTPTASPTATGTVTPTATATPVLGDFEAAISGQITVLANGDPVFGAQVCAQRSFPAFERCAFSAGDGRYTIRDLQPGNYTVTAADPGGRFVENCHGALACDDPERIGVSRNELVTGIDITLDPRFSASFPTPTPVPADPTGSISGRILIDGNPFFDDLVCAFRLPDFDAGTCVLPDDDGMYEVLGLPTGNYEVSVYIGDVVEEAEIWYWCYRMNPFCDDPLPVGVVDGLGRTGIDFIIDSSLTVDDVFRNPTPTPFGTSVPLPPTPPPTPTTPPPTPTPTPVDNDPFAPAPYTPFRQTSTWADVPHVGTGGVGTYALGLYPFGAPIEPIIGLMSNYFGAPAGVLEQGRVIWWGIDASTPMARIEADGTGALTAASINLFEVQRLGPGPVFLGNSWLLSEPFVLDSWGFESDRFVYLEDDEDGLAVRCAVHSFCTRQEVERNPDGSVADFGNIVEFFGTATAAPETTITDNVTADGRVALYLGPDGDAPTLRSIDLSGGVTAGVLGAPHIDPDGTIWVRLTEGRDPRLPTGWARADQLRSAPVADRAGPLPRMVSQPTDLTPFLGALHTNPFEDDGPASLLNVLGIDERIRAGTSTTTVDFGDLGASPVLHRIPRDEYRRVDFVLSEPAGAQWRIIDVWSLQIGTDQLAINSGSSVCPFLRSGDNANLNELVSSTRDRGVAGWIWQDRDFVEIDVSDVVCPRPLP